MIIMNHEGRFWLGKRIGTDAWQFPQGGIDKGENLLGKLCIANFMKRPD